MFQQATDVMPRGVTQQRVALLVIENVLAFLPETLVSMHARAVILKERLRHHGHRLSAPTPNVLDDVLVEQDLVSHLCKRGVLHIDFSLAGGPDFVVMNLDNDTALLEPAHHLTTNVVLMIHRRHPKVTFLVPRFVTEVRTRLAARVPRALFRIDEIKAVVVTLIEANVVEDVELDLWSPVTRIGDSG